MKNQTYYKEDIERMVSFAKSMFARFVGDDKNLPIEKKDDLRAYMDKALGQISYEDEMSANDFFAMCKKVKEDFSSSLINDRDLSGFDLNHLKYYLVISMNIA